MLPQFLLARREVHSQKVYQAARQEAPDPPAIPQFEFFPR
jgi:hypothetical protein